MGDSPKVNAIPMVDVMSHLTLSANPMDWRAADEIKKLRGERDALRVERDILRGGIDAALDRLAGRSDLPMGVKALTDALDRLAATPQPPAETVRERAVREVDARHGYTAEFAPSPAAHAAEYDEREVELLAHADDDQGGDQ